jgi:1,4-dihydroxy-2-naphthoate octaprenyltransferase
VTTEAVSKNKSYIVGSRLPFVSASVLPAILGAVWCWVYGNEFSLFHALLGVLGVFFLHLGANTLNDYFDWDESDRINRFVTPFSGGSRSRVEKVLTRKSFFSMTVILFLFAATAGLLLIIFDRPLVLLIGTVGGLCGILYSMKPFSFQSRGIGEFIIFLAFGPLITLGMGYVNFGDFRPEYFLIGIPNGFVVANILWINEFPDYEADRNAGKRNLVVRLGTGAARYGYIALEAFFYISVIGLVFLKLYPVWSLLTLLLLPVAITTSKHMWEHHADPVAIVPAQGGTIQFQMMTAVATIASFVIDKFL